jgi:SAM-dependent methyltransferase
MPIDPKRVLGDISGGRVLDVATGTGGFVRFLLDGLRDHAEIVGIDTNAERAAAFSAAYGDTPDIRFEQMDAHHLGFLDHSFDTVCISNSLHHFADPDPAGGSVTGSQVLGYRPARRDAASPPTGGRRWHPNRSRSSGRRR